MPFIIAVGNWRMNKKNSQINFMRFFLICISVLIFFGLSPPKVHSLPIVPFEMEAPTQDSPVHKESVNLLKQDSFDRVIEIERLNLKDNPNDIKSYLLLTLAYLGKGDEKQARAQAAQVEKINQSYAAQLYSSMARFFLIKNRFYKALHYFHTSLEIEESPNIFNQIASIYLTQGRLKKAKVYYEKTVGSAPDFLNLSRIYLAERDYPNSIRYAQKAVQNNPELTEGLVLLGTAYLLADELTEAETTFLQVKKLDPKLVLADYNLGLIHLGQMNYNRALHDFTQIVKLAPRIKEAHLGRAAIQHLQGKLDQAESEAALAIRIDPMDFLGHLTLANILISKADFISADNVCRHAGNLFIEFTLPWFRTSDHLNFESSAEAAGFTLANIYHRNGLFKQEIDTIQQMYIGKSKKNAFMLMMEARAEIKRENYNQAMQLYHAAIKLNSKLITPYMEMGDVAEQKGDLPEAIDCYIKATKIEPEVSRLYFVLGDLYLSLGDAKKAVSNYQTGLRYAPESGFGYNQIAWVLAEKENKYETALTYALKALKLNPDSVSIRDTLGWIYYRLQRYKDAFRIFSEIDSAAIHDPAVFYHLGVLYQKLQKNHEAKRFFEAALNITDEFPEGTDAIRQLKRLNEI